MMAQFCKPFSYLGILLYDRETYSFSLWEERRLKVLENKVKGMLGPQWEEVAGEVIILYTDDLQKCYCYQMSLG
jgi:hypothetical protein